MSFHLTAPQVRDGSKTVTRRLGWTFLRPGDHVLAVEKYRGVRVADRVSLGVIEVVSVRREALNAIDSQAEVIREGFRFGEECGMPTEDWPSCFVGMFMRAMGCRHDALVTRIEFRRLPE